APDKTSPSGRTQPRAPSHRAQAPLPASMATSRHSTLHIRRRHFQILCHCPAGAAETSLHTPPQRWLPPSPVAALEPSPGSMWSPLECRHFDRSAHPEQFSPQSQNRLAHLILLRSLLRPFCFGRRNLLARFDLSASTLKSSVNTKSPEFEKNSRRFIDLMTQ